MNTEHVRQGFASHHIKRILLGSVCLLAFSLATAAGSSPAAAKFKLKSKDARKETEHVKKLPFGDIPKGPLEIFVSISQQKLHFYSDGVHVADEPVATGVPGHLTPLGVFSVIERDRYHHSNLYSNAPMPFMERITWSGVALHQGPGVGHQASHGCIRMPEDFASRLWQLPTMGMRVIIAGPELRPIEFADPHLFVHKTPVPTAALTPAMQTAQTITGTKTDAVDQPASAPAATPAPSEQTDPAHSRAEAALAAASQPSSLAAKPDLAVPTAAEPASPARPTTAAKTVQVAEAQTAGSTTTPPVTPAASQAAQPNNATQSLATVVKSAATNATEPSEQAAPSPAEPAKEQVKTNATAGTTAEAAPASVTAPATPTETANQATPPASAQPAPAAPAQANTQATTAGASAPAAPASSIAPAPADTANAAPAADTTAPNTAEDVPLPLAKPAQIVKGGGGPIAIFISRKNSRIYVRQDFTPVFDAPVKIENPNEPIGTHVFTALDYLPDHSTFRWNETTLPGEPRRAEEHWKYVRDAYGNRKRVRVEERPAQSAEQSTPETPQEALARIEIPQDVIDQISRLIVPGSSLIISDQGLGPETGSGTDFIVVQR